MDPNVFYDVTMKSYLFLAAAGCYNFLLFTVWGTYARIKEGRKMSAIFWSMAVLFASLTTFSILNIYARHLRFEDVERYMHFMQSDLWAVRHIPCSIILIGMGFFMTRRVFWSYYYKKETNRRYSGSRSSDIEKDG